MSNRDGLAKVPRSSKWGAACAPCVVAKTRCVRSKPRGLKCDRCQSLRKDCSDQAHEPRKKRQPKSSKIDLSKGSNNSLVDSLKPFDEGISAHNLPDSSQNHSSSTASTISPTNNSPSQNNPVQNVRVPGFGSGVPASAPCSCSAPIDDEEELVPSESDETLLSIYKNQLSPRFPFVIIPPDTTARQLGAIRPILMKVIRMVASVRHLQWIRRQSHDIIQNISQAMLMGSERSLDLLQSILVFLGFYHYHCMTHAQFNNLHHLALSLMGDMDLTTDLKSHGRGSQIPMIRSQDQRLKTNEEKRTFLGVWYMSSNVALIVKQLAPMKYTKYIDQCLKELDYAAEYETDRLAVQLLHIQHLTNKISHFHNIDETIDELPGMPEISATMRIELFRIELDKLWNALPPNLKTDYSLFCHYNSAYLRLFEPLLQGSHLPDAERQSLASLSLSGIAILDVFSSFTSALKKWFDDWLTVPVCSYFYISQPTSAQLIHASMMLSRWARVAGPRAINISTAKTTAPRKDESFPLQPLAAFSGVPECPDLGLSQPPALPSISAISTQSLSTMRAQILANIDLQVDIFSIMDAMVIRFQAAKKEMAAAQGGVWKNNMWDLAAEHIKMKKLKVENWCEIVATVSVKESIRPRHSSNNVEEESECTMNALGGESIDCFDWLASCNDHQNILWESDLFDELMMDIHTTDRSNTSRVWGTGVLDDVGLWADQV